MPSTAGPGEHHQLFCVCAKIGVRGFAKQTFPLVDDTGTVDQHVAAVCECSISTSEFNLPCIRRAVSSGSAPVEHTISGCGCELTFASIFKPRSTQDFRVQPEIGRQVVLIVELLEILLDLVRAGVEARPLGMRLEGVGIDVSGNIAGTAGVFILEPGSAVCGVPAS